MLQEIDKARLDKVLEVIKRNKIRFPLAEIVKELGSDKGMVSAYLNGKKPISDKFYSNFMQKFDRMESNGQEETKKAEPKESKDEFYMDTIKDLRHSGITLSEANRETASATRETATANRILAENQRDLIEILKVLHKPTVDAALGNPPNPSFVIQPYLDRIAQYGIDRKWWKSFDEGRVVLGKLVHEVSMVKQE
jgi:transcriptional regulator with XRE-family HTH domain